jgi:hypothetical protein
MALKSKQDCQDVACITSTTQTIEGKGDTFHLNDHKTQAIVPHQKLRNNNDRVNDNEYSESHKGDAEKQTTPMRHQEKTARETEENRANITMK